MEGKKGFFDGLVKIAGKIAGSEKFLEFVRESNLGDLINVALQTPTVREGLTEKLTEIKTDIIERYDIRDWKWWAERENNKVIVQLYIDEEDMRKDFIAHFKKFMQDLKGKFGGGFDAFVVFYKVGSIAAHVRGDKVEIELVTERVADLQAAILELATAKDIYQEEGEDEQKNEG